MTQDEHAIRDLIERWAEAVRAHRIDDIVDAHASDLCMFDVPPPTERRGIDAYRRSWEDEFYPGTRPGRFDLRELEVVAGGDVGYARALVDCTDEPDGQPDDLIVRLTVGLRLIEGRWTITHEHHSLPAG